MLIVRGSALRALLLIAAVVALLSLGHHGGRSGLSGRARAAETGTETGTAVCGNVSGTWSAAGAPYLICPGGVTVSDLVLDGSDGAFSILATGAGGITVSNNQGPTGVRTTGTSAVDRVTLAPATATAAGSWAGLTWDYQSSTQATFDLAHVDIRDAVHGIGSSWYGRSVSLDDVTISGSSGSALSLSRSALTVTDSTITSSGGVGVADDCEDIAPGNGATPTSRVSITGTTVTGANGSGIELDYCEFPVVQDDVVERSGLGTPVSPAILLNAQQAYYSSTSLRLGTDIAGNVGAGNGIDAISVSGTQQGGFTWLTPTDSASRHPLGYLNEGIDVVGSGSVDFPAGSVVKSGIPTTRISGEPVTIPGIYVGSPSITTSVDAGSVFTSIEDDTVGPPTCASARSPSCTPASGQWGALSTFGESTITGSTFRWGEGELTATIEQGAGSLGPPGTVHVSSSTFSDCTGGYGGQLTFDVVDASDLTLTHCDLGAEGGGTIDGVTASASSIEVGGAFGVSVTAPTRAEDITLTGGGDLAANGVDPVLSHISVTGATQGLPAVQLSGSDLQIGPGADVDSSSILGSDNDVNALGIAGSLGADLTWDTPAPASNPAPLGFFGQGALDIGSHTLTVPAGGVVKAFQIRAEGGTIDASAGGATFVSADDDRVGISGCPGCGLPQGTSPAYLSFDLLDDANGHGSRLELAGATLLDLTDAPDYDESGTLRYLPAVYVDDPAGTASVTVTASSLAYSSTPVEPGGGGSGLELNGGSHTFTGDTFTGLYVDAAGGSLSVARSAFDEPANGSPFEGPGVGTQLAVGGGVQATVTSSSFTASRSGGYQSYPVSAYGSSSLAMTCSSIHGNAGGIQTSGSASVSFADGDLDGNATSYPTYDVDDPAGHVSSARTWWGQPGGPVAGQISHPENATVTDPAPAQTPTAQLALSGPAYRSDGTIGPGELDVTATLSRAMDTTVPLTVDLVDARGGTHAITGDWASATSWRGSIVLSTSSRVDGGDTVRASGARGCVPDPSTNAMPTASQPVVASGTGGAPPPAAGTYSAVAPVRLLDTRHGTGSTRAPLAAGKTLVLTVAGAGGLPGSGVGAVVLNLTATGGTGAGYLTAFADGSSRPATSNVNYGAGQTVPNLAVVPVGSDGKVDIYNGGPGAVQVIGDVSGFFASGSPAAGGFAPVGPARLLDTRHGTGAPVAALAPGHTLVLTVAGQGGLPRSGVGAVILNVTATVGSADGYLTAFADGTSRPGTSNVNYAAGQTVPNLTVVPVGSDGKVAVYNSGPGTVQVIADTSGYFTSGGPTTGGFVPVGPARLLDTRHGTGAPTALAPGRSLVLTVAGQGGLPGSGVGAVVLNVTATGGTAPGYLTAWADGSSRPSTSNVNYGVSQTVPNLVVAPVGSDGKVAIFNGGAGTVEVIADTPGYFTSG